ncbi:MAG: hypothetical protein ABSH34_35415, partial [Verrucomicrobiota bacterium]
MPSLGPAGDSEDKTSGGTFESWAAAWAIHSAATPIRQAVGKQGPRFRAGGKSVLTDGAPGFIGSRKWLGW